MLEIFQKNNIHNYKVFGFDTDESALEFAKNRISNNFSDVFISFRNENFLDYAIKNQRQLSLFEENSFERFHVVIANPPYVRTQIMGASKAQSLARKFELSGRVDLYHAFLKAIAYVLEPGGIAGIIVSNRFLSTKSGATIRKDIVSEFEMLHIWDLGDTRLFEAAVLPAVLLVKKKNGVKRSKPAFFTSIYSANDHQSEKTTKNSITALSKNGLVKTEKGEIFHVRHGQLAYGKDPKNVWRIANERSEKWLAEVETNTAFKFSDIGKIRVGVKTTADKIFIRTDWDDFPKDEYPELLKPVTTHYIARRYKPRQPKKQRKILYPHTVEYGKRTTINLEDYPKTSHYLCKHREILESRTYLKEAGRKWYEIWVPQDPNAWSKPKIVFRDIAETPTFWIDFSGSVVNGDCYWVVCKKTKAN